MTLSHRIKSSDKITVPQSTKPWDLKRRVALVNNYGAAGSNAAILLRNHPVMPSPTLADNQAEVDNTVYPILLSAKSSNSLQLYMDALKPYLLGVKASLGSIAYNIARRHNASFEHRIAFTTTDTRSTESVSRSVGSRRNSPVILCFGGQTGRKVTVSKGLYDSSDLFRSELVSSYIRTTSIGLSAYIRGWRLTSTCKRTNVMRFAARSISPASFPPSFWEKR